MAKNPFCLAIHSVCLARQVGLRNTRVYLHELLLGQPLKGKLFNSNTGFLKRPVEEQNRCHISRVICTLVASYGSRTPDVNITDAGSW